MCVCVVFGMRAAMVCVCVELERAEVKTLSLQDGSDGLWRMWDVDEMNLFKAARRVAQLQF